MNKPLLKLANLASDNVGLRREIGELRQRLSAFEKRAEAEALLLGDSVPSHLRPQSVDDFMTKRAQIEDQDLETVKLAMKMSASADFSIGDVEDPAPKFPSSGSQADDMFTEWLLGTES